MSGRASAGLALALACAPTPAPAPAVEVTRAWGFAPTGPDEAAVYFTVRNTGAAPDTLLGISTPAAAEAVIHRAVAEDGMVRMEALDALPIAAGSSVELRPGGMHLMLVRLASLPAPGDTLRLTLRFARSGGREVAVPLLAYGAAPGY